MGAKLFSYIFAEYIIEILACITWHVRKHSQSIFTCICIIYIHLYYIDIYRYRYIFISYIVEYTVVLHM